MAMGSTGTENINKSGAEKARDVQKEADRAGSKKPGPGDNETYIHGGRWQSMVRIIKRKPKLGLLTRR